MSLPHGKTVNKHIFPKHCFNVVLHKVIFNCFKLFIVNLMVKFILLFGVYTVVSYCLFRYLGLALNRCVMEWLRWGLSYWHQDIPQHKSSAKACWAFYQVFPIWVKKKKKMCVCMAEHWGGGSIHWATLYDTSLTILFKHTFYRCHSFLQGPLLLLIYVSIKQYGYNGFMAPLALGETGERPTADTDRGDL